MSTVVHVTHEAIQKIGGIGAVLHGLFTSVEYLAGTSRNILVGPYWQMGRYGDDRLGPDAKVIYSSLDGFDRSPLGAGFREIEDRFGVSIIYGQRTFADADSKISSSPEIVLIDVSRFEPDRIGELKFKLWERFGIDSGRYEQHWDYEQWMRLAEPALAALRMLGAANPADPTVILSHEYMGMPTVLAATIAPDTAAFRTIFHAHEVATIRRLVEDHPGHDARFYNAMRDAMHRGKYIDDVFGSQDDFYKHALIKNVHHCDELFGVGDSVLDEFRFLGPDLENVKATLAYNGTPHFKIDAAEKERSRDRLLDYCQALLGSRPDFVLTHVTRLVPSKGLWRDLSVMAELEQLLRDRRQTAALIVLSTETAARRGEDVLKMERDYAWPIAHREGHPDMTGGEAKYYAGVQAFNARARNAKVIYLNQFGFSREANGLAMPEGMEFMDIRKGSDAEFGQSIYEPFGIAQVETISFGGACVFTSLCGCAGLVRQAVKAANLGEPFTNAIEADYTRLPASLAATRPLEIGRAELAEIERIESRRLAIELMRVLPATPDDRLAALARGQKVAAHMSWDAMARNAILPGIRRAATRAKQA